MKNNNAQTLARRDRPKSAPYLRLKNSKRNSKCKSIVDFGTFYEFFLKKSLTMPKKTEREDPLGFFNNHSVAKLQKKLKRDPFEEKSLKKVAQCRKNSKEGPFGLVRYCMLRGKAFWFSSLGQQVQFGVFSKFCRAFGRTILSLRVVLEKH